MTLTSNSAPSICRAKGLKNFVAIGSLFLTILPMLGGCAAAGVAALINSQRSRTAAAATGSVGEAGSIVGSPVSNASQLNFTGTDGLVLLTVDEDTEAVTNIGSAFTRPIGISVSISNGSVTGATYTSPDGTTAFNSSQVSENGPVVLGETDDTIFTVVRQDYSNFGIWAQEWSDDTVYVAGMYSGDSGTTSIPVTGVASYSGAITGFYVDQLGAVSGTYGVAGANVDFTNRTGTFSASSITLTNGGSGSSLGFSGSFGITNSSFSGAVTDIRGNTGPLLGEFFGPDAAEMVGLFNLRGSGTEFHGGSFGLRKQ